MSSDDLKPQKVRRAVRTGLLGLVLALPLAGCFQPLYAPLPNGTSLDAEMKAIEIAPINDRTGHYLRDKLIFAFNGTGTHVPPKYKLIVSLTEQVQTPLTDTVTGFANGANVTVVADFRLEPSAGGVILYKDKATVFMSYDRTIQRYSDVRAARDAEIRDAERLAEQIHTLVATALAKRNGV